MRGWIPPIPLALGALFGALSWVLVILYGVVPSFGIELAWIHAVALGSFTTIALSILIHVVPGFTDLSWRGKTIARSSGVLLPFAAAGFVISFATGFALGIAIFGIASALLILAYASAAIATLAQRATDLTQAAVARAFLMVVVFLSVAALLGGSLAYGYLQGDARFLRLAPEHGAVALVGWLTLLTMGVSARTFRPILGDDSRWRAMHVASNSAMLLGAIAIPLVLAFDNAALAHGAFAIALVAAVTFASDGLDRVRRARTPNKPAQAFIIASLVWLVFSALAATAGAYDVAVVVALSGWLGQMVNAHLHHIGVRVIATAFAGDENETRPWELLDLRLSWATVVLSQLAVVFLVGAVFSNLLPGYVASGCAGLGAALAFGANASVAIGRAKRIKATEGAQLWELPI